MNENRLLYFTQAELEIMLELCGGSSIYRTGSPPDDTALTRAFVSLYRRNFLIRQNGMLVPGPRSEFFRQMCSSALTVVLTSLYPRTGTAVCYADGGQLWIAEILRTVLSEQIRLRGLRREELETWLQDSGRMEPPFLTREDTEELSVLTEKTPFRISKDAVWMRLEKYRNRGQLLGVYEFAYCDGLPVISVREGKKAETELYTVEAREEILERCFGKDCI